MNAVTFHAPTHKQRTRKHIVCTVKIFDGRRDQVSGHIVVDGDGYRYHPTHTRLRESWLFDSLDDCKKSLLGHGHD